MYLRTNASPEGQTMNKLANMLHSLCCDKDHSENMEDTMNPFDLKCHYYLEQTIDNPWEERDHIKWLDEARTFMADLNASSADEALDILRSVMGVVRTATALLEQYPAAHSLLVKLLS